MSSCNCTTTTQYLNDCRCFTPKTQILMADKTTKDIVKVKEGDRVINEK